MNIAEIKAIMSDNDFKAQIYLVSHLCDVFESGNKNHANQHIQNAACDAMREMGIW